MTSIDFKIKVLSHLITAVAIDAEELPIDLGDYSSILGGTDPVYLVLRGPVNREIVIVDPVNSSWGNYLKVSRGQGGTSPVAWPTGTLLFASTTADFYNNVLQTGETRTIDYNPNEILTPLYKGEKIYQNAPAGCERWWKSWDGINPYWDLITGVRCKTEVYVDIGWTYDILKPGPPWTLTTTLSDEFSEIYDFAYDSTEHAVYAAGHKSSVGAIYKSLDGGETWSLSKDFTAEGQASVISIAYDAFNDTLVAGTGLDGRIYQSTDQGATWVQKYDAYGGGSGPRETRTITYDSTNHVLVAAYSFSAAWVVTSTDGGATWTFRQNLTLDGSAPIGVNKLVYDSSNDVLLAYGTNQGQMFRSINQGVTWTFVIKMNSYDSNNRFPRGGAHDSINDVSYVGYQGEGRVYKTVDGGLNWTLSIYQGVTPPDYQTEVWSLAFNPVLDIMFQGTYNDSQVWITDDQGATWELEQDLARSNLKAMVYDAYHTKMITVAHTLVQIWTRND